MRPVSSAARGTPETTERRPTNPLPNSAVLSMLRRVVSVAFDSYGAGCWPRSVARGGDEGGGAGEGEGRLEDDAVVGGERRRVLDVLLDRGAGQRVARVLGREIHDGLHEERDRRVHVG